MICDSGAIPDLLILIHDGSPGAQETAAAVISKAARRGAAGGAQRGGQAARRGDGAEQRTRANAVWVAVPPPASPLLTAGGMMDEYGEMSSRLEEISDGITPLVALLGNGSAMGKERGVGTYHLAADAANRVAIAKAGGIAPPWRCSTRGRCTDTSMRRTRSRGSRTSRRRIRRHLEEARQPADEPVVGDAARGARAAPARGEQPELADGDRQRGRDSPLVAALVGATEAKDEAKAALLTLALNNPSNQLAIATGLVALLGTGWPRRRSA